MSTFDSQSKADPETLRRTPENLTRVNAPIRRSYRKIVRSEAFWAFMLGVMILVIVYWFNTSADTKNDEPFLRAPLSIPPTPQLVKLEDVPPSLSGSAKWLSMTTLGKFPFPVSGIDVTSDGVIYAAGLRDTQIEYCYLDGTRQNILAEGFNPSLDEVAVSSTEHLLATGTHDGSVLIWKWLENGESRRLYTLRMHPGPIQALTFSPTGKLLAAGTDRGTWLWNIEEVAKLIGIIPGEDVSKIAFSDNGRWLATVEKGHTVWIRSLSDGEVLHILAGFQGSLHAFAFSPEDTFVLVTFVGGRFRFLSSDIAGNDLRPLDFTNLFEISFPRDDVGISSLAFSENGERLIIGTTQGDIYGARRSELSEVRQPFQYFEKLPFNHFTDEEIQNITGCGRPTWHQALLKRPASTNFEIAQIQSKSDEKFSFNSNFEYLGSVHDPLGFNSFFYILFEDINQRVFLAIHEPDLIASGVALAYDFLDKKVGSNARVESNSIDGVSLEYLSGNWSFYITDEPVFFTRLEQFDDVQWRSEWESGSNQQTLRWKQAGNLYEIISLANQSGDEAPESGVLMEDDLLDFAREIITHMRSAENSP